MSHCRTLAFKGGAGALEMETKTPYLLTILSVNRCSHQYSWQFTTAAVLGVLPIHLWVECSRTGPGLDEILFAAASGKEASSEVMSYHLWFSV